MGVYKRGTPILYGVIRGWPVNTT